VAEVGVESPAQGTIEVVGLVEGVLG